jgi:DNA ligase 4
MFEVDALLTELASSCAFSASSVRHIINRRSPCDIIKTIYSRMSPLAAGFLTQIILKDMRTILYPISETHYTACLLQYNSKSVSMLTMEDVMKAWDSSGRMLRIYRVRMSLEDAAAACDNPCTEAEPLIGVPIQVCHSI